MNELFNLIIIVVINESYYIPLRTGNPCKSPQKEYSIHL